MSGLTGSNVCATFNGEVRAMSLNLLSDSPRPGSNRSRGLFYHPPREIRQDARSRSWAPQVDPCITISRC